jgi:hypothetical protein
VAGPPPRTIAARIGGPGSTAGQQSICVPHFMNRPGMRAFAYNRLDPYVVFAMSVVATLSTW